MASPTIIAVSPFGDLPAEPSPPGAERIIIPLLKTFVVSPGLELLNADVPGCPP
jgi:hypothetical protein